MIFLSISFSSLRRIEWFLTRINLTAIRQTISRKHRFVRQMTQGNAMRNVVVSLTLTKRQRRRSNDALHLTAIPLRSLAERRSGVLPTSVRLRWRSAELPLERNVHRFQSYRFDAPPIPLNSAVIQNNKINRDDSV